ncbi:MAG: hypothetical protein FWH27_01820 [Planctomycetaceae bacterium]|nr:hypothetical protein [Planctomycetaceae bacterium]
MHFALCTLHFALCTLHSALCTLHSALCTLHSAFCIENPVNLVVHFFWRKPGIDFRWGL